MLVAIAVLAVLAVLSFRGLSSVLEAQAHVSTEARRWTDTATVLEQMSRDLSRAVARPVREGETGLRAALRMRGLAGGVRGEVQLEITRLLGDGDDPAMEGLRRVGYRLRANTLEYLVWPTLDPAPGSAPTAHPVLDRVLDLRLRALGKDGRWAPLWPAGGQTGVLPRALEARLFLSGGERITRIFVLP